MKEIKRHGGTFCGDSLCRLCNQPISMEEGVLFHHKVYHLRSKEAKQAKNYMKCGQIEKENK